MSDQRYPDGEHIKDVCRIGQGAACCRYLTMSPAGWSCEKLHPEGKALLDARVAAGNMNARADNCEGLESR